MRTPIRRSHAATVAALAMALMAFAAPALAKEALDAQLEAPIARDTPGGTILLLGVRVTMTDATGTHDIDASPVYVRLTGPDGDSSLALATQSRPGHYTVRVTVPVGGVKAVEVGMHGSPDLPYNLVGFTIVPGSISAKTAQVAPPLPAATAPVARATAAPRVVAPAQPAAQPVASTPVAAPADPGPAVLVVGALALVAVGLVALALVRRTRIAAHPRLSGRSPGA